MMMIISCSCEQTIQEKYDYLGHIREPGLLIIMYRSEYCLQGLRKMQKKKKILDETIVT